MTYYDPHQDEDDSGRALDHGARTEPDDSDYAVITQEPPA